MAPATARLLRLYRRTDYVIDGRLHLRIGRRSADADALLRGNAVREGALITAANPGSRPMPPGWNRRMNARLADALAGRSSCPAEGRLGAWREPGLFVGGDIRALARVGRRFRQNALVHLAAGRPARLRMLSP